MKLKRQIVGGVVGIVFLAMGARAERIWPGAGVEAVAGKCATATVTENAAVLRAGPACPATVWPAVYFTFSAERDLSKAGAVRVTLTNRTDRALRVGVKVKAVTVQGRLPDSSFVIQPFAAAVKDLRLFAESWAFDKPHGLLGLKRNPGVGGGSSYSLERVKAISVYLPAGTTDAEIGVCSVETMPGDGEGNRLTVLKADSFCPWVDEFGQANYAEWPDKVHSRAEFLACAETEAKELAAHPTGIPDADRFGGWAAGPQLKATGFFRTEKVNGKWWLVDPDGHLFISHGVNCGWELASTGVSGRETYFEKLPPREGETKQFWTYHKKPVFRNFYGDPKNAPFWSFSFSAYDIWLKFGADWRRKNAENTVRRLRSWGLNTTTGTGGDLMKTPGRVPYVVSIGPTARKIEGANGYWGKLIDPFAPEFAESCRRQAEARQAAGTNAWCLGWTSNNELSWGADGAALARGVLASPDDQPAKVALLKMLVERGIAPEKATAADLRSLGEAVAEKYYSTVRAAIKAVAPNHLYLGDRNDKRNPEVFRAAARNLDVVTVNVYEHRPSVTLPKDALDKPLLVTEFHFGCYDTGYFYASLIPVKDQKTRAACYRDYLRTVVDRPDYVGAHWFCWRDCPITGQLGEGANAQCGLVSTADVPYSELVSAIRDIAREMYLRRFAAQASLQAASETAILSRKKEIAK